MNRLSILYTLCLSLSLSIFICQNKFNPSFAHLNIENGFPAKNVGVIKKDADGMLWMTTEKGLMKYNGYSGKFYGEQKDSTGLLKDVNAMFIDRSGIIWIGYRHSYISSFNPKTEKFTHYYHNDSDKTSFPIVDATVKFFEDSKKRFWILTWQGGMVQMDRKNGKFKQFYPDKNNPTGIHSTRLKDMVEQKDGTFILGTFEGGNEFNDGANYKNYLEIFNAETETFTLFPIEKYDSNLPDDVREKVRYGLKIVNCIYLDKFENLWIGSYTGLVHIDRKTKKTDLISAQYKKGDNLFLIGTFENARNYVADNKGKLWFATASSGVMIVDMKTKECFSVIHDVTNPSSLSDGRIRSFYRDNEDNIWITTRSGGIDIYNPLSQQFKIVSEARLKLKKNNGEEETGISKLTINKNEVNIPNDNGISILDVIQDSISNINPKDYILADQNLQDLKKRKQNPSLIRDIVFYSNKILMVIPWGSTVLYDIKTKKYSFVKTSLTDVIAIGKGMNNEILATGSYLAPNIERKDENWVHKLVRYDSLKKEFIDELIIPRIKGIGGNGGEGNVITQLDSATWYFYFNKKLFYIYNSKSKTAKPYSSYPPLKNFPDSMIHTLFLDKDKKIWLSGENGVYKFDYKTGKTINYRDTFNLKKDDRVFNLVEDKNGTLWIALKQEMVRYDPKSRETYRFNSSLGLNPGSFRPLYLSDQTLDNLYFPSIYGLLYFNPDELNFNRRLPKMVLSEVIINNDTLSELEKLRFEKSASSLNWDQNFINFEFASDQIYAPGQKKYYYRLLGLDTAWIGNGIVNKISYTNLASGSYTLEVKCLNPYNIMSKTLRVPFKIAKAFWWQWWFILLELLAFGLLIRAYIRFREKKLNETKEKLEQTVTERTQEIKIQNDVIQEKNKELTDSIQYAKRIQYALLAHEEFMNEHLSDHFVLFKPKDIVSGDFYWATQKDNLFFVAICDSTGHGVPGAFMSLLNISFLNEAISEKNILEPNLVLNYVRKKLIDYLSFDGGQDGMDGCLICYDKKKNKLTYASAYNKPILIRNNTIQELKADKMPIGKGISELSFNAHEIQLQKGDVIYLYTDGYADQFGGAKGKKFKYKQLEELLLNIHQNPVDAQKRSLNDAFENWKGNLEQVDDVLLFGIKI